MNENMSVSFNNIKTTESKKMFVSTPYPQRTDPFVQFSIKKDTSRKLTSLIGIPNNDLKDRFISSFPRMDEKMPGFSIDDLIVASCGGNLYTFRNEMYKISYEDGVLTLSIKYALPYMYDDNEGWPVKIVMDIFGGEIIDLPYITLHIAEIYSEKMPSRVSEILKNIVKVLRMGNAQASIEVWRCESPEHYERREGEQIVINSMNGECKHVMVHNRIFKF